MVCGAVYREAGHGGGSLNLGASTPLNPGYRSLLIISDTATRDLGKEEKCDSFETFFVALRHRQH